MTYSLFEWVRESLDTLLENQPETLQIVCDEIEKLAVKESSEEPEEAKQKVKKEQLTKGQKRAAWKKGGMNEADRERGWNWVDVVKIFRRHCNGIYPLITISRTQIGGIVRHRRVWG